MGGQLRGIIRVLVTMFHGGNANTTLYVSQMQLSRVPIEYKTCNNRTSARSLRKAQQKHCSDIKQCQHLTHDAGNQLEVPVAVVSPYGNRTRLDRRAL